MSVFQQEGNRLKYHYDAEELWLEPWGSEQPSGAGYKGSGNAKGKLGASGGSGMRRGN